MSVVLFFVLLTLLIYFIKSKYDLYLLGYRLTGPWAVPFVGNVQVITRLNPEYLFLFVTSNRVKFRQTYRLWLGPMLWVFLHSPEETRDALNDSSLSRADTFQQLNVLIGNGLLISEGKYWQTHRTALGPAFHPTVLNGFAQTIEEHADILVERIFENIESTIEASHYLFPCILDAIIDTSMGINLKAQRDPAGTYTHAFHNTSKLLFKRMVNPLLISDFVYKKTKNYRELQKSLQVIHNLMDSVIERRAAVLKENLKDPTQLDRQQRTLLTILLTTQIDGQPLNVQEIRDEVNTFVFAGVDTTTAAMSFILYSLARYTEEQTIILEEIQKISSAKTDLTVSQINSLVYLDMFIKECLRFYTIVPMTGRQTTKSTKIGNIDYCAGVTIWINMYGLAHDEQLFEQPNEFRPLRFSEKNAIKSFSYLPFSGGPHVCIGRKYALLIMKILTIKLVQNFEISLSDPNEKLILKAEMVLKSLNGINLKFKLRD